MGSGCKKSYWKKNFVSNSLKSKLFTDHRIFRRYCGSRKKRNWFGAAELCPRLSVYKKVLAQATFLTCQVRRQFRLMFYGPRYPHWRSTLLNEMAFFLNKRDSIMPQGHAVPGSPLAILRVLHSYPVPMEEPLNNHLPRLILSQSHSLLLISSDLSTKKSDKITSDEGS